MHNSNSLYIDSPLTPARITKTYTITKSFQWMINLVYSAYYVSDLYIYLLLILKSCSAVLQQQSIETAEIREVTLFGVESLGRGMRSI